MISSARSTLEGRVNALIRGFARDKAVLATGIAAALVLSATAVALAVSVPLPPGGSITVPATTPAAEPDLAGTIIHDVSLPFTIKKNGAVLCAGQLQNRVVRSSKGGGLDFYYRIRRTSGQGAINRIETTNFSSAAFNVAYRKDGLGTVPPQRATRSPAAGARITFALTDPTLSCAQHRESRFILIKTALAVPVINPTVRGFIAGGSTRLFTTKGESASVTTVMPTVMP